MQMSADFANTVATVAPVILLVATVEMARMAPVLKSAVSDDSRLAEEVAGLYADGAIPSREQLLDMHKRTRSANIRTTLGMAYYFSASTICLALLAVEMLALAWLADPSAGPQPGVARSCQVILAAGFGWTVASPLAITLRMMITARDTTDENWALNKRFKGEVKRVRRDRPAATTSQSPGQEP